MFILSCMILEIEQVYMKRDPSLEMAAYML